MVCFLCSTLLFAKEYKDLTAAKADEYLSRMVPFGFNGAVLISSKEGVIINNGYGYANPKQKILNTDETVFSLGSIVKPFTATLTMRLVQEGELSLENTLSDFFADIPEDKANISIHHLLSHSSGLPSAIGMDTAYISKQNYLSEAMDSELNFAPGGNYSYSNVGFTLLSMIIERLQE
jgi:CubicO group peptidase (beta-lactamase class C family)